MWNKDTAMKPVLLVLLLAAAPAQALDRYRCVVEDFMGFGNDATFEAMNKRKAFTLLVTDTEIVAIMTSKDFQDAETRYHIHYRDSLDTIALEEPGGAGLGTLVMPATPDARIARKGYFNTTIALQSTFYLNTWLLRCAR